MISKVLMSQLAKLSPPEMDRLIVAFGLDESAPKEAVSTPEKAALPPLRKSY